MEFHSNSLNFLSKQSVFNSKSYRQKTTFVVFCLSVFLFSFSSNAQSWSKRLNCGSTTSQDYLGETYEDDETASGVSFTSGSIKTPFNSYRPDLPILMRNMRYIKNTNRELIYNITVPQAGDYAVKLYFAEPFWGINSPNAPSDGAGVRVFDVIVQGTTITDGNDVDIFARLGEGVLMLTHDATVTSSDGGILTIEFDAEPGKNDPMISAIEVVSIDPDISNPSVPSNFQTTSLEHDRIDFTWTASTDVNGIANYVVENITNNTTETIAGSETSYQVTGLTPETLYEFRVKAIDPAGNNSDYGMYSSTTISDPNVPQPYNPDLAWRINAGGPAGAFGAKNYVADIHYSGGTAFVNPATGMEDPYVTERYNTSGTLTYNFPLPNGEYRVVLHFSELWYGATGGGPGGIGLRVFDVNIEGDLVEDNYDIFRDVGAEAPDTKQLDVNVSDGILNILLSSLEADGGAGDPKISAIEILGTNQYAQDNTPPSGGGYWTKTDNTDNIYYTNTETGGNVGIGTDNPGTYKLAVNGTIHSKEVRVDLMNWPDYVFNQNHKLPTLEEVEEHIQKKGYLINMPSAEEVEANGVQLGEMNKLLLEKIEELTLYILEMKKEIKELQK